MIFVLKNAKKTMTIINVIFFPEQIFNINEQLCVSLIRKPA